ncbi:unnamed protein product [Symbiodinium sp. CCMP2592]|nr:unnamed protein product [Symbiodinium sp. CCMP2592]
MLMQRRAELLRAEGAADTWAEWLCGQVDLGAGETSESWHKVVQQARNAIIAALRKASAHGRGQLPTEEQAAAQWFWGEAFHGKFNNKELFKPYDPETNLEIEKAFQEGAPGVSIKLAATNKQYRIDFLKQLQINCSDSWKHARPIQRRELERSSPDDVALDFPKCKRAGCGRPSFDGRQGEYCSKTCREMDNASRNSVQWLWGESYVGEFKGQGQPYDKESNKKIEQAFQDGKKEVEIAVQLQGRHTRYRINFELSTQVNLTSPGKLPRSVRRWATDSRSASSGGATKPPSRTSRGGA